MNTSGMSHIRLAYDITALGTYFSWPDSKTGIYRVAEEVLNEIVKSDEVSTTFVGICGETPAFASIGCQEYFKFRKYEKEANERAENLDFQSTFRSYLHMEWFYQAIYKKYFSKDFQSKNKRSLESLMIRGPLKLMEISRVALLDTYKIFDPSKFDILHSTYYALPAKELTKDLPRLITIYDLIPLTAKDAVDPRLNTYFYKILSSIDHRTDWVACISEFTRQEFCDYTGFPKERAYVTPLAADEKFRPIDNQEEIDQVKSQYKIPDSAYFLCLASHLEPRKNIFHLVESFVKMLQENPHIDVNLVLIGSLRFKREDVSKSFQEFKDFTDRIIFTGYVPDEDLSAIYSGSTAFVFPSLHEGFGLPLLEAMQTGAPVISSNATSLPEVAGNAAILVDPKDKDQLCQAMLNLLKNQELRQQLIQKGFEQASKFSWFKCAQQTIDIYETIVANRR